QHAWIFGDRKAQVLHRVSELCAVELADLFGDILRGPSTDIALDRIMGRVALELCNELFVELGNARDLGCRCSHSDMRDSVFSGTASKLDDLSLSERHFADERH